MARVKAWMVHGKLMDAGGLDMDMSEIEAILALLGDVRRMVM